MFLVPGGVCLDLGLDLRGGWVVGFRGATAGVPGCGVGSGYLLQDPQSVGEALSVTHGLVVWLRLCAGEEARGAQGYGIEQSGHGVLGRGVVGYER